MKTTLIFVLVSSIICANARTLTKRDATSDLLAEVDDYVAKAKTEIERLIKDTQKNEADHLQTDMDELIKVAKELKTTTGPEAVKLLTEQLTKLLGPFKAKVDVLTDESIQKDLIITTAETLVSHGEEEVKKLMSSARLIEARLLEIDVNKLKQRVDALKETSDNLAIKALELDINLLSVKINTSLRLLGFEPSTAQPTEPTTPTTRATTRIETSAPTKDSTKVETRAPTTPSRPPTVPSKGPTTVPSKAPTTVPSKAPTTVPSKAPTTVSNATNTPTIPKAPKLDDLTTPPTTPTTPFGLNCDTHPY